MKKYIFTLIILLGCSLAANAETKVVGHRGARWNTKESPATPNYENTLEALKFAQSLGIYAAEFDINLTADGKLVVFHGPQVPGSDKKIQELTFAETQKIVLPGGHKIPTLKEWFKQAKKHPETKIIMEIKKHPTPELETKAVEMSMALVKKMKMEKQIEYTSFSEWMCKEILRVDPNAKVLYLAEGDKVHDAQYVKDHNWQMSYKGTCFMKDPKLVTDCQRLGVETTLWLVNDKKTFDWAVQHGIDYITSDHPEIIKGYMDEYLKNKK